MLLTAFAATDIRALDGKALPQYPDLVVIDGQGFEGDAVVDHWLFAADNGAIKSVYCSGVPVVQNGRHKDRDRIAMRYGQARQRSGALP